MTEYLFPTLGGAGSGGGTSGGAGSSGVLEAALAQTGSSVGVDILCATDLDPQLSLVGGFRLLAQDLLNRLSTPRGGLFYDESYGYDLRDELNTDIGPDDAARIAALVVSQCMMDDRVADISADVLFLPLESRLKLTLTGETEAGPFWFVLSVDEVTVELLEVR